MTKYTEASMLPVTVHPKALPWRLKFSRMGVGAAVIGLAALGAAHGEINGGFEEHRVPGANDRNHVEAFLGKGGKGWAHNWILQNKGEGVTASGVVRQENSLDETEKKYVEITVASGGEGGSSTLYRVYQDYADVRLNGVRTISFQFRLDSPMEAFGEGHSINFSEDNSLRQVGRSWWISVQGGENVGLPIRGRSQESLVWTFYDGQAGTPMSPNRFLSSGLALETGKTYTFTITTDPLKNKWKAAISDGATTVRTKNPENPNDPWLNDREVAADATHGAGGCLLFSTILPPESAIVYSLTGLSISADPGDSR